MKQIEWMKVAKTVLLSREMDRLEVEQLTPQGKVKYQFSAGGHELVQVLMAQALDHPHDAATAYYRSRPFALACGLTPAEALSAGMARSGSPSEGRDAGVMFNMMKRNGPTILPSSGDVGAQYTPAAGWAQAANYRQNVLGEKDWSGAIAVTMGGEASVAANGFWSALTIATTLKLPILFCVEDNQYGLSVPASFSTPGGSISANLASFGNLKVLDGTGTEPEPAWECIQEAVNHVRSGAGPCLLRMRVVRLAGHTFIDDQTYKSPEFRVFEREHDPLKNLQQFLIGKGVTTQAWEAMVQEAKSELAEALAKVENEAEPDKAQVTQHRYYEGIAPQQGGLRPEGAMVPLGTDNLLSHGPRINLIDAVRRTLEIEMKRNPRLLVFGEDVGVKGGVHGATLDMQANFGPDRVFDTSLSEEGIMGRATGMALAGLLPVPEIQFRKYADPAFEQIDDLGTLRWRTANHFAAPVVVRIPVGFGKQTGDPWHSVTGEAIYAHLVGWWIAFPSNAADATGLLRTALRGDDPTFFFEHRALLDTRESRRPYPGDDYCLPFGKATRLSEGNELTVVSWGAMVPRCLQAAQAFDGRVTVIDLRTILPWDQETFLESVRQTGKALIVHEDTLTAGFAGEIIATIVSQAFTSLDAPVERMGMPDIPVPFNLAMMEAVLPTAQKIQRKMQEILEY